MHRQNSLQPYNRRYTHSNLGFLDYLEPKEDGSVEGKICVSVSWETKDLNGVSI